MIRTRFAPSPTGYMHIGNLRTALFEYLIAKRDNGKFVLRIEDTDQKRLVDDSINIIYDTLKIAKIYHDEGPDIGGEFGPYTQSQRLHHYKEYALKLVEDKKAYFCFCGKEDNQESPSETINSYDRRCLKLSEDEIAENLKKEIPYVIRQLIPEGSTTFSDVVFGEITVENSEIEDQILLKTDGFPTYNFANVVDDSLMNITHVVRGSEYLSSTPKYNLLYNSLGFDVPTYIHLPLINNKDGGKLSKRKGDASFQDLIDKGFLPDAIINYIALLGYSPNDNNEIFNINHLIETFDTSRINKSPSVFDIQKLTWLNGEYFKNMSQDDFFEMASPYLNKIERTVDKKYVSSIVKSRINFLSEINELVDFIDNFDVEVDKELFVHKKMKTTVEMSKSVLEDLVTPLSETNFSHENLEIIIKGYKDDKSLKMGQVMWPIRTALSLRPTSPCGAIDIMLLLGKEESIRRLNYVLNLL